MASSTSMNLLTQRGAAAQELALVTRRVVVGCHSRRRRVVENRIQIVAPSSFVGVQVTPVRPTRAESRRAISGYSPRVSAALVVLPLFFLFSLALDAPEDVYALAFPVAWAGQGMLAMGRGEREKIFACEPAHLSCIQHTKCSWIGLTPELALETTN